MRLRVIKVSEKDKKRKAKKKAKAISVDDMETIPSLFDRSTLENIHSYMEPLSARWEKISEKKKNDEYFIDLQSRSSYPRQIFVFHLDDRHRIAIFTKLRCLNSMPPFHFSSRRKQIQQMQPAIPLKLIPCIYHFINLTNPPLHLILPWISKNVWIN